MKSRKHVKIIVHIATMWDDITFPAFIFRYIIRKKTRHSILVATVGRLLGLRIVSFYIEVVLLLNSSPISVNLKRKHGKLNKYYKTKKEWSSATTTTTTTTTFITTTIVLLNTVLSALYCD
uniref:Uncharacterized protein n=1 Tax=Glossina brevipalpis TaxID=37001 RepID=A0A1A9WUM1_9MUSC